jgi:isopentenyldiphosphate isomerase
MEMLDVVCADTGVVLGDPVARHEAISKKLWCRSTNVFVMNEKGEILVHQRTANKERFPNALVTHVGGHVGAGETFESNALKELEEEAGIIVTADRLLPWRTTKIPSSRLWVREFVTVVHSSTPVTPQPGEVERFIWMSPEAIMQSHAENPQQWMNDRPGTHHFETEYACLRAVATAAHAIGTLDVAHDLSTWHPFNLELNAA